VMTDSKELTEPLISKELFKKVQKATNRFT
jgi:hypothetical protein